MCIGLIGGCRFKASSCSSLRKINKLIVVHSVRMELSNTNFDIDLDSYDTEIPWLKSVQIPNAISKSVQAVVTQNSTEINDVQEQVEGSSIIEVLSHSLDKLSDICNKLEEHKIISKGEKGPNPQILKRKKQPKPAQTSPNKFHKYNNIIPIEEIIPPPSALERKQGHCLRPFRQTGQNRYICTNCGKHFLSKSILRIHQKIHTGIGMQFCRFCQKSFTRKNSWEVYDQVSNFEHDL